MFETVDIVFQDRLNENTLVKDVYVRVHSEDGKDFFGDGVSDENGIAQFLLPAAGVYQLRFFAFGMKIKNPIYIEVLDTTSEPATQGFIVKCDLTSLPTSVDPHFCRLSGFFRGITGVKAAGIKLSFVPEFFPLVMNGAAIIKDTVYATTDKNGWVSIDLVRGAMYNARVETIESISQRIAIPDESSWNIVDVLFPQVRSLSFTGLPTEVAIGQTVDVPVAVTMTDSVVVTPHTTYVSVSSSDPNILDAYLENDYIRLMGRSAGTVTITFKRRNNDFIRIPNEAIINGTFEVSCALCLHDSTPQLMWHYLLLLCR